MGLLDFVKEAGQKLFDRDDRKDEEKAQSLTKLVGNMGFEAENLEVAFDDGKATIRGTTRSQAEREKIVLLVGNTQGVGKVDDQLQVKAPPAAKVEEPAAKMYTVKPGDSLSKIAAAHYGRASAYMVIFEANKPMLEDPDKIYPGQVLRIPPQA